MASVKHIKKARQSKRQRACAICRHIINVGESYKIVSRRSGSRGIKTFFCQSHSPRPSHLLSGRSADLASIVESIEDGIQSAGDDTEALQSVMQEAASDIEDFAAEIQESADNIEDGFGHSTMQSEAMADTANNLEEWAVKFTDLADEIDTADDDSDFDYFEEANDLIGEQPELELQG